MGKASMSAFCGAVATRSNFPLGRAALAALFAVTSPLAAGCAGGDAGRHAASTSGATRAEFAWTASKAVHRVGGGTVTVAGRRAKVDSSAVVCWGVGTPVRRRPARLWQRFDCIAPTFRGAEAGPDILLTLEPTGPTTLRIVKARFSSYGGG
jgi:hypothetical protein